MLLGAVVGDLRSNICFQFRCFEKGALYWCALVLIYIVFSLIGAHWAFIALCQSNLVSRRVILDSPQ
jgi:hypothetical protein